MDPRAITIVNINTLGCCKADIAHLPVTYSIIIL